MGERHAERALRRERYKILYRNFRSRRGEIDLVCRHKPTQTLAFIEVKTRSDPDQGRPLDAVNRKKRRRLIKAAYQWISMLNDPAVIFRFDVVEVIGTKHPKIEIIQDAFRPDTRPKTIGRLP